MTSQKWKIHPAKIVKEQKINDIFFPQIIAFAAAQSLSILPLPILSRLYSPTEYGEQSTLIQTVAITSSIATLRYEALIPAQKKRIHALALFKLVVILSIVNSAGLAVVFIFLHQSILSSIGQLSQITILPWWFVLNIALPVAIAAQNLALNRREYNEVALIEILAKAGQTTSALFFGFCSISLNGLITATIISQLIRINQAYKLAKNEVRRIAKMRLSVAFAISRKNFRLAVANLISNTLTTASTAIISLGFGKLYGYNALGQLSMMLSIVWIPSAIVSSSIGNMYLREASIRNKTNLSSRPIFAKTLYRITILSAVIFIPFALLSNIIVPAVLGSKWETAAEYGKTLSTVGFFSVVSAPFDRTPIIFNSTIYPILWSGYRCLTSIVILLLATLFQISHANFIILLSFQLITVYIIDIGYSLNKSAKVLK